MAIDTTPGGANELAIIAAIKNGMLTEYAAKNPDPAEMETLARAIAPGIMTALQHIKDSADVTGVTSGAETVTGGID